MTHRCAIAAFLAACVYATQSPTATASDQPPAALADTLSNLLRDAIPLHYDKQKDWGATREIIAGYRVDGKPFHYHVHRRKRAVEHGVWKHYKLRVVDPGKTLRLRVRDLRPIAPGRMAFTLDLESKLDAWARAKVYQYGVHIIALEVEGDVTMRLEIKGEIALTAMVVDGSAAIAAHPVVTDARLALDELHIRRVSNARGPIVRELSEGIAAIAEEELNGPKLTARLNRAIEKKRDALVFAPAALLGSSQ
jgi:hypothetical protein